MASPWWTPRPPARGRAATTRQVIHGCRGVSWRPLALQVPSPPPLAPPFPKTPPLSHDTTRCPLHARPPATPYPLPSRSQDPPTHTHADATHEGDLSSPAKMRLTVEDPDPKNWIAHKYTRFDNTSTEVLGSLLAHIEPITFGKFAMRAIRSQRQKTFLELLEFATRLPRSTHLTGDLRHLPTLREKLEEAATAQQHRSREVVLPPDWSRQGVFQIRIVGTDDNDIVVLHMYSGAARPWPLPLRLRDQEGALIGIDNLVLEQNHFEESALVKSPLCMDTFRVANLGSFDTKPHNKRPRRLALPAPDARRSGSPCSPLGSPPSDRLALEDSPPGSLVSHVASGRSSALGSATAPVHRSSARLGRAMKGGSSACSSAGHATSSASGSSIGEQPLNVDPALEQTLEGDVASAPSGDASMGTDGQLGDVSGGARRHESYASERGVARAGGPASCTAGGCASAWRCRLRGGRCRGLAAES